MDASTTLSPVVPFTVKSGSTTPPTVPFFVIFAVETGWKIDDTCVRAAARMSASVCASPIVPYGAMMKPSHTGLAMNRRAPCTAAIIAC